MGRKRHICPAFSEHEEKGRYSEEKLNEWKKALRDISFRSGYEVNNSEDEARVLKEIENCALKVMEGVRLWVAEHPIGLDKLVQGFQSVTSEDKVKITGIVGMGGSGKTTLAKELFNRNFSSFQKCSFVPDVRDAASRKALPDMQRKLLQDLGVDHLPFHSVDEGKAILANRLRSLRALIVVDDVDHIDQLYGLLPNKDNLGNQSMVIITSRELGVLISWGLSCIYIMPTLGSSHAEQLFCWHAFKKTSPPADFKTLVQDFLNACNGLPLSLKVLGVQLYGVRSKDYWKSLLDKISKILPTEIQKRLQISYDALDDEEKEMFLDVACFLIGEWKSTAIALWDGSGWNGLHGLQTLVNKCLVEIVYEKADWRLYNEFSGDKIRMHDHLRDMGREIASRHSSYRLWRPEQIDNMEQDFEKRMPIRGIRPPATFVAFKEYSHQIMGNSRRRFKRPRLSCKVQILDVQGNEFTEEFKSLSEHLVWLRWNCFDLKILPPWLTLRHLSVLELHGVYSLEQLWQDNVDPPPQLRELVIQQGYKLQQLPTSIGHLKYLKKLSVDFRGSSLPEEVCGLPSLEFLDLRSSMLCSLPAGFGNLIRLKHINLRGCSSLSILPNSFSQLIGLQYLNLSNCAMLSSLPGGFGNLISLKHINLKGCTWLRTLPNSFSQLIVLEDLNLSRCASLFSLPGGFGNLISLKQINLKECRSLSKLPNFFSQLTGLEDLNLSSCAMLFSLPDGFGNLISLKHINLGWCSELNILPNSFSQLTGLEDLNLSSCALLSSLPGGFGNLISLKRVNLAWCSELNILPNSFSQLTGLEDLNLSCCALLSSLPGGFGNLISLKRVNLYGCSNLSTLPESFKQLVHLEHLNLFDCAKLKLKLDVFENMKKLKMLKLNGCEELEDLPNQIANQASLTELDLEGCIKLSGSPTNIRQLVNLQFLTIESVMLEGLQTSLVSFSSLKNIQIVSSQSKTEVDAEEEERKPVFRVSISNDCCPNLESFKVRGYHYSRGYHYGLKLSKFVENRHLTEIETLPVSLKMLSISRCEVLKNISCLSDLVCLESLILEYCPQLEELSSFADLASLKELYMKFCPKLEKMDGLQQSKPFKESRLSGLVCLKKLEIAHCPQLRELPSFAASVSLERFKMEYCPEVEKIEGLQHCEYFEMSECPKVEKIEGLQHSKSLKELLLPKTGWKVPVIQSLEKVEGLERLVLECDTISALKPCILSMKGCPWEMKIQGSVSRFVEPVVDSLKFPDLAVEEGEGEDKIGFEDWLFLQDNYFYYEEGKEKNGEERKVVAIYVELEGPYGKADSVDGYSNGEIAVEKKWELREVEKESSRLFINYWHGRNKMVTHFICFVRSCFRQIRLARL